MKSPLTILEICDAAVRGDRLKKYGDYEPFNELLWLQIRDAWQLLSDGKLNIEQFSERKKKCIVQARRNEVNEYIRTRLLEEQTTLWMAMETVGTEYAKNRTLENADRLYEALYKVPISRGEIDDGNADNLEAESNVDRNADRECDMEERDPWNVPCGNGTGVGDLSSCEAGREGDE